MLIDEKIVSLQIEYNLFDRMIEDEVLPFCNNNKILTIAYSPLDQGRIADGSARRDVLIRIAGKYNKTPAQVALRWLTSKPSVIAIPTARSIKHLEENASSINFNLEERDIKEIDHIFKRMPVYVLPDRICVSKKGQGNRLVYQTIEEATENKLHHVPSPVELTKYIQKYHVIKPVRLIRTLDTTGKYDYDLVEGRIRYWAWVIAHGNTPIPAYVREDWCL